tara:strand:+ start:21044 stop:21436 length:393 start_codon:yes stop_codon:yes gene_type:complete
LKSFNGGTKQIKGKKMRTLNDYFLTVKMTDVSTSGSVFVTVPDGGTVIKIMSVIDGAIGTADAVITPSIGGTNITNGAITITQSGSAAGDVDTSEPTAANSVVEGDSIKLTTNGASSNTIAATFTIIIRR